MGFHHFRSVALLGLGIALIISGRADAQTIDRAPSHDATTAVGGSTVKGTFNGEFVSEAGRFSITLPSGYHRPLEETTPLPLPGRTEAIDLKTFSSQTEDKANAVTFSYSDMTGKLETKGREKAMLDASRDNVLETMNATLEKEMVIRIGEYPGKSMIFSLPGYDNEMFYGRLELYVVGSFSYQIMYLSMDRSTLESPEINAYFKSFKLAGN